MTEKLDDTLDMAGDWNVTFGYGVGLKLIRPREFVLHYDIIGPGDHGGVKFKGHYVKPSSQTAIHDGETYYDGRGVQIVQILESLHQPNRYLALLCGTHKQASAHPGPPQILGCWVDVGGYVANFEMVKIE